MGVVIYHNPDCGTSRNVLALIRHVGIEPTGAASPAVEHRTPASETRRLP